MHTRTLLGVVAVINEHPASVYAEEKKHCHLVACDSTSETARRQAALSCCREVGGELRQRLPRMQIYLRSQPTPMLSINYTMYENSTKGSFKLYFYEFQLLFQVLEKFLLKAV
jgi:hypothetical protein